MNTTRRWGIDVEFLVEIRVDWPPDGDAVTRDRLIAAERQRAHELTDLGRIKRLWRRPGAWANVGIWEAIDADELHEALVSLPFYPWLSIQVAPLAHHPDDPATAGNHS
jgi:muconolactone D-isomerase